MGRQKSAPNFSSYEMSASPERATRSTNHEVAANLHRDAVNLTKEYGIFTLRTCLILNGGAILAILGLLGSLLGKAQGPATIKLAEFLLPFYSFGFGLAVAAFASICGYFNFLYSQAGLGAFVGQSDTSAGAVLFVHNARRARFFMLAAHGLGLASLAAFIFGAIAVGQIFARH